jgi:hypothetical protein
MAIKKIIELGEKNPKKLFLVDGFGAVLSIIMLVFVLVKFETAFGIPKSTLYFLASLPLLFAIYDFYCYFNSKINITTFLFIIGFVNISYCFLSVILALYHVQIVTYLGWTYILLEILVVGFLAIIELKVAKNQTK